MTEYEKIKEVITKYKEFFENTITDVGHTEKGRWFFFQKEENQTQYRSFVEFDTAEALEQLILEAVAEEMNVMVKTTTEALVYEVRDIDVNGAGSIEGSIAELARYIKILNKERQNNAKMVDMLFRSLEGAAGRIIEGTEVRK